MYIIYQSRPQSAPFCRGLRAQTTLPSVSRHSSESSRVCRPKQVCRSLVLSLRRLALLVAGEVTPKGYEKILAPWRHLPARHGGGGPHPFFFSRENFWRARRVVAFCRQNSDGRRRAVRSGKVEGTTVWQCAAQARSKKLSTLILQSVPSSHGIALPLLPNRNP